MKRNISIEELKALQLEILQAVHDYCQAHNLRYSLAYGTLIGAVRHQGYIPWDDDIDLLMPREDYEQLLDGFSHPYLKAYDCKRCADYTQPFAKVADTRTVLEENSDTMQLGINIDIFPVDDLYDTREESAAFVRSLAPLKRKYRMKILRPSKKNVWWKRIAIRLSKLLVARYDLKTLVMAQYIFIDRLRGNHAKFMSMVSGNEYGASAERAIFEREVFEQYMDLPFEGRQFRAIAAYDKFLTTTYGDYMTPPEAGDRTSPHSLNGIYWK